MRSTLQRLPNKFAATIDERVFEERNASPRPLFHVTPACHNMSSFISVHDVCADAQSGGFILRCEVLTVVFIEILDFETSKEF